MKNKNKIMNNPIYFKTSFNSTNMLFWYKLNINEAALKEFNIAPLKSYFDGNIWIKSSDTNPMYIAEFGNCRTIIKPNSLNNIFENFFDREHPSIFGYSNLPNTASTLYVLENEIDVLLLDSVQQSAISVNKNNFTALVKILDVLQLRFQNIIILINNCIFESLVNKNIKDADVHLFKNLNNNSATSIYQSINNDLSVTDYLNQVNLMNNKTHIAMKMHSSS